MPMPLPQDCESFFQRDRFLTLRNDVVTWRVGEDSRARPSDSGRRAHPRRRNRRRSAHKARLPRTSARPQHHIAILSASTDTNESWAVSATSEQSQKELRSVSCLLIHLLSSRGALLHWKSSNGSHVCNTVRIYPPQNPEGQNIPSFFLSLCP
jgi:hypothetical protein